MADQGALHEHLQLAGSAARASCRSTLALMEQAGTGARANHARLMAHA
ncbi:MAG: hypothetical protein AVDCRST_MAG67-2311 [uncultured Solirubrobacteraceae bacterium]|uniref:Uncharacterized protein n=1 Tax=uncultured Solirubrobacteraceae bacterium TaxID=1162706 RepID=A0A6J4SRN3_9ACTN|nr:MAG: hypothetical protein AVDCRST_MAG67-2311 [uncultured Solirubrobacteraceae bacterium]